MASLSYLQPYLDQVYKKAESVNVPTPVLDALLGQLLGMSRTFTSSKMLSSAQP
jgi:hypothetical protein